MLRGGGRLCTRICVRWEDSLGVCSNKTPVCVITRSARRCLEFAVQGRARRPLKMHDYVQFIFGLSLRCDQPACTRP
jgi:hypothetical protein